MQMIAVEHVLFDYPGVRALDDVSVAIAKGTITALVGPNGAGKTTLLRCLAALDTPHEGRILIEGVDIFDEPRRAHRFIGYLPDFYGLYDTLTVRQCLTYAAGSQGVANAAIRGAVDQAAGRFRITELLDRRASDLSRGQRQRLAIAQATVHGPRLLLLDEPAAGLDPEARNDLSQTLLALARDGVTIIVSSHILTELEDYCTDLLILSRGRLVEQRPLGSSGGRSLVAIELAEAFDGLASMLAAEGIELLSIAPTKASLRMASDPAAQAALLQRLVAAGARVSRFGPDQEDIQELYKARVKS
ncbi:MAG: ABC transporter ATP-binding protein [Rhodospirillales bacterium]|nr:ABC transporter ATP-binding protein [Rhodospirillales bacterium]